jgi:hypothetical protein
MSRLPDMNAYIALMNGAPTVTSELWYGIATSVEMNSERLELLLSSTVVVLPFENQDFCGKTGRSSNSTPSKLTLTPYFR